MKIIMIIIKIIIIIIITKIIIIIFVIISGNYSQFVLRDLHTVHYSARE